MADILGSIVVEFGDDNGSDASVLLDDYLNGTDEEGNVITSFKPGETAHILVYLPPGYVATKLHKTSGDVVDNGIVTRDFIEEKRFFTQTEEYESLTYYPQSSVSADKWYGNSTTFTISEGSIKVSERPCIADISYSFKAYSISITCPVHDEEWPIGIVMEVTQ